MANLPVDFKDDIMNAAMSNKRRYRMINNSDGTVSFEDVTQYDQVGSDFGAAQVNQTNKEVNARLYATDVVDPMLATKAGFAADALKTKEQISELNKNIGTKVGFSNAKSIGVNGLSEDWMGIDIILQNDKVYHLLFGINRGIALYNESYNLIWNATITRP